MIMQQYFGLQSYQSGKLFTRVLVIDDDNAMTELLRLMLRRESFEVIARNTGAEGIEAARNCNPHVIILDLLMPDKDGWQICKAIREFSQTPILVFSALNNPGLVSRTFDAGADDFLIKPVSTGMLVAHINKLSRRARAERDAAESKSVHNFNL